MKKAKQSPKYGKTYVKGDRIIVNNSTYSFDNLHKLPKDPKKFSYKENKDWLIFGGPHSVFNFYLTTFHTNTCINGIVLDTLEHVYQYGKAIHFEDTATADKVLCTRSPAIAKQLRSKMMNFDRTTWDCVKGTILMSLLGSNLRMGQKWQIP